MAGGQERVLRRRIKSVQSTKKITKAMELISASRIVKAQQRVAASRPYVEHITEVIRNLARSGARLDHPMLEEREVRKVGFVIVTADRGLAGGYNSSVIRAAERSIREHQGQGHDYSLIIIGRKGEAYYRYKGYRIDEAFTGMSDRPSFEDARKVAAAVLSRFEDGEVDRVELVFTQFLSLGTQRVTVRRLLPVDAAALTEGGDEASAADYEFEPSAEGILVDIVPRYVEARLFGALLEASASEHAARQRAMKAATDNAEELIKSLQRVANRARQETITTEIMEIAGGAEALRQAKKEGGVDLLPDNLVRLDVLPDELDFRNPGPARKRRKERR